MHRSHPTLVALLGLLAIVIYAGWAAVQILVLNPLAAAPGLSLSEVYSEMHAAGETMPVRQPAVVLGVGVGIAALVAAVSIRSRLDRRFVVLLFLSLLVLGAPAYFIASFGPGMSIADAFGISGADASPWALPLYVISIVALLALVVMGTGAIRRAAAEPPLR